MQGGAASKSSDQRGTAALSPQRCPGGFGPLCHELEGREGQGKLSAGTCGPVPSSAPSAHNACSMFFTHSYSSHVSPGQSWNKWEHAAGKEPAPGSPCIPHGAGPAHWAATACSSATLPAGFPQHGMLLQHFEDYSPRGCFTGCSRHTHTKYTTLPANILITTLNKRLIWSLKGIFFFISSFVLLWKHDSKGISRDKNLCEILGNSAYSQNRKGKNNSQQASWSTEIFNLFIQSTFSSIMDISTTRWHLSSYNANSLNLFLRLL